MARSMNEDAHQPHFIENPINAFHFMRRMASDWNRVISDINCDECIETPASKRKYFKNMGPVLRKPDFALREKQIR